MDVVISIINIVVLAVLLRLILWKHIIRILAERSNRVHRDFDDVKKQRLDAEAKQAEYDKKLGDIERLGRDLMRESTLKASEEADKILNETREKAKEMINEANDRIAMEKEQALSDAHIEVVQLATDMAARILKREVSPDDNTKSVDNFFGGRNEL